MSEFDSKTESNGEDKILNLKQENPLLFEDVPCSSASVSCVFHSFSTFNSRDDEYIKLESAYASGKKYDNQLLQILTSLESRLLECRRRLREFTRNYSKNKGDNKKETFNYIKCGRPYFKYKKNQVPPANEDTVLMRQSQMYDFSKITSVHRWTIKDKVQFENLLLKMSQEKKIMELKSAIDKLKAMNVKTNKRKIVTLKREIDMVETMNLKDVALPLEEEYDWKYIVNKLKHRHTVLEYRALWKLFLHPAINKNAWSESEHTLLQKITSDENQQNWNKIASLLGTGRTGYQCFVYFRVNMTNTFTPKRWSKDEEAYLKRVIEYYKEGNYIPWGKVAGAMENRTKVQVYNKYLRLNELRKGRFLKEEDTVILTCNNKYGANFKKMAKLLPGRSATQCRARFQLLTKKRVSAVWIIEEDQKLVQLMANQDLSANYSSITQFFPGKTRQHIRSRYLTLSKWMSENPNLDIAMAPRRASSHRLGFRHSLKDLNSAIEELKCRIQFQEKYNIQIHKNSPEGDIDNAIIAMLINEDTKLEAAKKHELISTADSDEDQDIIEGHNLSCNIKNLRNILILFRASLDKNKFLKSPFAKIYKSLLEPGPDLLPKLRRYSKLIPADNLQLNSTPAIWGTHRLEPLTYVLPPNFSTVTACKKIMSFISSKSNIDEVSINNNFESNENYILDDETLLLRERFNTLYIWPLLLAGSAPEETMTFNMQNNVEQNSFKRFKTNPEDSD